MSAETRPAVELADAVEQLLTALVRSGRLLGDSEPSPLSTFQGVALAALVDRGPLRLGALADALATTDATASRTVDAFVTLGLAERQQDPTDRRGVVVAATVAGHAAVRRRRARLAALVQQLVVEMRPGEGRRLADLLGELRELLVGHTRR